MTFKPGEGLLEQNKPVLVVSVVIIGAFESLGHSWIYKCKFVEGPSGMKTEELVYIKMCLIPRSWDQSCGRA